VTCDELLEAWLELGDLPRGGAEHLATCPSCQQDAEAMTALTAALRAHAAPEPPAWLSRAVLQSAAPLLAARAEPVPRPAWRALAIALLPLPLILAVDWFLVRGAHALLSGLLPDALSLYLAGSYAVLLVTLLGLTYAAVPLLAARQLQPPLEEHHA
jgi:hypothetical protein